MSDEFYRVKSLLLSMEPHYNNGPWRGDEIGDLWVMKYIMLAKEDMNKYGCRLKTKERAEFCGTTKNQWEYHHEYWYRAVRKYLQRTEFWANHVSDHV